MSNSIQIPGIELGEQLGRGAYSVVYRGQRGGQPCAVKLPVVRGRWTRWVYREGVALARVHHPNLPAVLEVGEVDDVPYIAMELVDGETLADRLRRGPLDPRDVLDLARDLARALRAVHRVGLVHRDVKPGNIAFGREDGRVRLIDFGFATPIDRTTREHERAGTRGYAAPEQLLANAHVDGRADLFALGQVMLDCLADPRVRSLRELDPQALALVGDAVRYRPLLLGLVAEHRDARYADASALLADLDRLDRGDEPLGPTAFSGRQRGREVVGRRVELERLSRGFRTLGATGSFRLLRAERGAGKTLLLDACARAAREARSSRVVEVSCREGDPPLATLRRLFEECVRSIVSAPSEDPAVGQQRLRLAVGEHLLPFARVIAPNLVGLSGPGEAIANAATGGFAEGAAELLTRIAKCAGPLFVCLDDAQWLDPVSRDAVVRLAERTGDAPVAIVVAARPGTMAQALEQLATRCGAHASVLGLTRLDEAQTAELIDCYLADRSTGPTLARRVAALADGTPLGVLEVLGAFLDEGALRPQSGGWVLDAARAERISLPLGALVLLGRRVAELPPATRRVLETAAVIGTCFDERTAAKVVGVDGADLSYALADARQAGLIEGDDLAAAGHRLVHDSLREMLVAGLTASSLRSIHQRIAEVLDEDETASFETLCACARHYAAGETGKNPARAYLTARLAADAALARFDNETALHFLELARRVVRSAGLTLDLGFFRSEGEAHLRLGAFSESLPAFTAALDCTADGEFRAAILGRIAWVEQARGDPERAWAALRRAFAALGVEMPAERVGSAARTVGHLARAKIRPGATASAHASRSSIELLCDLHYQNARLGMEYAKPFRFIQSTVEALALSQAIGASRSRARACASYGIVLSVLGRRGAGARELSRAKAMATALGDAITEAFCVQLEGLAACVAGDFDHALEAIRESLDVHGPWLELSEYCLGAVNADVIESLRGRALEVLRWNTRATEREQRNPRAPSVAPEYLIHRRRAALAATGTPTSSDSWLGARGAVVPSPAGSLHRLMSWGPQVRFLLETGKLGRELEALVTAFRAERHNPRSVHGVVVEYYVVVAHVRVQQCLRSGAADRARHVHSLHSALVELRQTTARAPLYKAHCHFIEAAYAWCSGSATHARAFLAKAEALAETESAPWVLSSVARLRAHMLRADGKTDAARDQARISELLATQYGAEPHAQWVREEFSLPAAVAAPSSSASSARMSSRLRRQLTSLLTIVRSASASVPPSEHAERIVDELLVDVDAGRAVLWFRSDPGVRDELVVARTALREAWAVPTLAEIEAAPQGDRVFQVPLLLHESVVGGVRLERNADAPAFSAADRELLVVLSHQIPVAFEIGRLVTEREQLQRSLQHARKMDAVDRLAGGVAHDYGDMLVAIRASLELLQKHPGLDAAASREIQSISSAMQRAAQLTSQLLSLSRQRPMPLADCQLTDTLSEIEPVLRRLAGNDVRLTVHLTEGLFVVGTIRAAFDQALVNLVLNAREAMPGGGSLSIGTRNAFLDAAAVRRGAPQVGDYVAIDVADTGSGMTPETLGRIFDPFFTTKTPAEASGLGLTTVHAFVRKCGGHIEVMSEVGRGTKFSLYLPRSVGLPSGRPEDPAPSSGSSTILVVDGDVRVRSSVEKVLERAGYVVLGASGSSEAVDVVRKHGAEISLVILDMTMPGMTGAEFGRRLVDLQLRVPVLFVSGSAPEGASDRFLQKPFEISELLSRVRRLLDAA